MYELYDCARPTHLWGVWMVPICTYGVLIEDEGQDRLIAKNQEFTFLENQGRRIHVSEQRF